MSRLGGLIEKTKEVKGVWLWSACFYCSCLLLSCLVLGPAGVPRLPRRRRLFCLLWKGGEDGCVPGVVVAPISISREERTMFPNDEPVPGDSVGSAAALGGNPQLGQLLRSRRTPPLCPPCRSVHPVGCGTSLSKRQTAKQAGNVACACTPRQVLGIPSCAADVGVFGRESEMTQIEDEDERTRCHE